MFKSDMIAPCGMNCGLCLAFQREKNKCPGCRESDENKPKTRVSCRIKNCKNLKGRFCFSCKTFPCARLKQLDKRYRLKYKMSMIKNLADIKMNGIIKFLQKEKDRWECLGCGKAICVHRGRCIKCDDKD